MGTPKGRCAAPSPPHPPLTLALVGDHGHGEVDVCTAGVGRGADGVIAGLQQRQLGEQQRGGQPHGWELLQHLQQCGAAEPLPVLVQTGVLQHTAMARQALHNGASSPAPNIPAYNIPTSQHPSTTTSQHPNIPTPNIPTPNISEPNIPTPQHPTPQHPNTQHPSNPNLSIPVARITVLQYLGPSAPQYPGNQQPSTPLTPY